MHKDSHAVQMGAEENLQIKHLDARAERPLKMNQEWLYPVLRKLSMWGRLSAQRKKTCA